MNRFPLEVMLDPAAKLMASAETLMSLLLLVTRLPSEPIVP
mgnify:CR=1 FL=1